MTAEPAFLYDDAYITLESAQALWRGSDTYFGGTPPLYGVTSPFHCVLVALLQAFLPPLWALLLSSVLGALCFGVSLWRLGEAAPLGPLWRLTLIVTGLGSGMISQHLVNGLETSWALAAVTWMLWATQGRRPRALAILAGSAPFVRPELALLSFALLAWAAFRYPDDRATMVRASVTAAVPWLVLLMWQTGGVVPTTLGAKRDWYAEGCWPIDRRAGVLAAGLAGWLWTMPGVALGLAGAVRTAIGRTTLVSLALILVTWSYSVPNVLHTYQRHRYLAICLPLLLYGLTQLPRWSRPVVLALASGMAVVSTASVIRFEPTAIASAMSIRTGVVESLRAAGASRVLLHDAGYLAHTRAGRSGVDMVGLKTPLAADLHAALTGPSCGSQRGEALRRLANATEPSHLVIWEPWDQYFRVTDALRSAGWTVALVRTVPGPEPVHVYALRR